MASALQAQLAALNGTSGKHPGSTFAPSRSQEAAIGRGIDYSIQQGQIVYNRDIRFRATIIYKTPKEAADVPLRTLEENCKEALMALSEEMPALAATSAVLCGHENASNSYIQTLLIRITILLGEKDPSTTENCLHVVEYLLRRYQIHRYLMESLLWTFLPHHQQLPNLWHRCLLLVDLASHPSYLWLRPYADPHRPVPTPRALCARHVVQEIPLLRKLCEWVHQTAAATEHAVEPVSKNPAAHHPTAIPLRGWSHVFSWTAACLVDGLVWQQQQQHSSLDRVAMARILVPAVRQGLRATSSNHVRAEDYHNWACVVASTMAECLDLSPSVVALWGTTLLQSMTRDNMVMDPSTAWSALASILLAGQDPLRVQEDSYLCLLPQEERWIGCPLPTKLFEALEPSCVIHLGNLYHDQQLQITPLAVAILVQAMHANHVEMVVALLEHDKLTALWKEHNLVASITAWVVRGTLDPQSRLRLDTGRAILQALCTSHSSLSVQTGIAHVANHDEGSIQIAQLQVLTKGIVTLVSFQAKSTNENTSLLPPRVALEHPDVEVRRRALAELVKGNDDDEDDIMVDAHEGENLMESLVRRWSIEPDVGLAKEFMQALINSQAPLITSDRADRQCQEVLIGAHHWIDVNNKGLVKLLPGVLEKTLREAKDLNENGQTIHLLREAAASLVDRKSAPKSPFILGLLADSLFVQRLIDGFRPSKIKTASTEQSIRQRCALAFLASLTDTVNGEPSLAGLYLKVFVLSVRNQPQTNRLSPKIESAVLRQISALIPSAYEAVVPAVVDLATLDDNEVAGAASYTIRRVASSLTDPAGNKVTTLAVIMEAALRSDTPTLATKNLIHLAKDLVVKQPGWIAVVPSFALLSHSDKTIREASIDLLSTIGRSYEQDPSYMSSVVVMSEMATQESTSIVQLGTTLPGFLAQCVKRTDADAVRQFIMDLAIHAIFTSDTLRVEKRKKAEVFQGCSWIPATSMSATREAGCTLLEALEVAGEEAFPLSLRWNHTGRVLFEWLVALELGGSQVALPRVSGMVGRLLKGAIVSGPQVLISSGPRPGGVSRSRSYSVGNMDGVEIVRPYPQAMVQSILEAIETSTQLRNEVVETALGSTSWSGYVFPVLESIDRKSIVKSMLKAGSENEVESLVAVASSLPLDSNEVSDLLDEALVVEREFPYLAALIDYVKATASRMTGKKGSTQVLVNLFAKVRSLGALEGDVDEVAIEFLMTSSLRAIQYLLTEKSGVIADDTISSWINLVLSLLGAPPDGGKVMTHHLGSRGRSLCITILGGIASFNSKAVVESVADLTLRLAYKTESFSLDEVRSGLSVSVPLFWSNVVSSSRSITSFLKDMLAMITNKPEAARDVLMCDLVKSMCGSSNVAEEYRHLTPGIIALILFLLNNEEHPEDGLRDIVLRVFESSPVHSQVLSLPFLVSVAKQAMGHILGSPDSETSTPYLPTYSDIIRVLKSSNSSEFDFIFTALSITGECCTLESVLKQLRKRNASLATSSLQLWQNLLLIQSTAEAAASDKMPQMSKDSVSWRKISAIAEQCREAIQTNLPPTVFIAAVRSLLNESVGEDLISRAMRLAADRVQHGHLSSHDRSVFVDFISDAAELIKSRPNDIRCRQSALIYIDHAAQSLFQESTNEKMEKVAFQKLGPILSVCCDVVKSILGEGEDFRALDIATWHLLASVSLACATLIRTIGIKALPKLTGLLKPILGLLSKVSSLPKIQTSVDDSSFRELNQIAVLRLVECAVETVPQSVYVHLPKLLSESCLFSESVSESTDPSVVTSLENVHTAITHNVPTRLLVPALVRMLGASDNPVVLANVLRALRRSIAQLVSSEGGIYRASVVKAITKVLEFQGDQRSALIELGNRCLLELVLKLSELQFRKMYGDLCEWMKQARSERIDAFWSISEILSSELKTIFLPCASLVFEDIVKDLQMFVGLLTRGSGVEKLKGGRKKRKKSFEHVEQIDATTSRSLIPLLATVASILRADAQEGGKWTREHGRYHALLQVLSKLLKSRIPNEFQSPCDKINAFEFIVESNPRGSVVDCLTSLALAAGDEQLWKPLNHAVLDACGNSERAEVRKAGLICLLSLIQALGEEYMVLLPECLPVLAELLEDENETVTGLARDAVSKAEELLGESLEANLM